MAGDPRWERQRRYHQTDKGREVQRAAQRRYDRTDKRRAKNRRRLAAKRARVAAIKLAAGCAGCGYNRHACALDFDHIADNKRANVSALLPHGWDVIEAEIAKCEVVCANCHRERTQARGQGRRSTKAANAGDTHPTLFDLDETG